VVYGGPATALAREVLTRIYGDEDWSAISRQMLSADAGAPHPQPAGRLEAAAA